MNPDVNPRHGYYQSLNPIFPAEMNLIPSHSPIAGMEMCSIQALRVMNATIRDMRAGGQLGTPGSFSCNACLGFLYLFFFFLLTTHAFFFGLLPCSCMLHCRSTPRAEEHFILLDGLTNEQATCGWGSWRVRLTVAVNSLVSKHGRRAEPLLSEPWPAGKMTCFLDLWPQPKLVTVQKGWLLTNDVSIRFS